MAIIPGSIYAPPGVYTRTLFENPLQGLAESVRLPLLIGTGSEILSQSGLEVVRGSSSSVDQRVVQEDETGRAVVSISDAGAVTLGAFDGTLDRVQVRHFPIVTGSGSGTTATDASSVNVTVNGEPVVVLAIDGAHGILTLSVTPEATDEVKVTYFFKRTDTLITDDLSDQITPDAPIIDGAIGQNYTVLAGVNDELSFLVDDEDTVSVTISPSPAGGWNASQIAAFINSAATGTSLSATTVINNFGQTVVRLTADRDITVNNASANGTLGITAGATTARNKTFYVFQRPIVDGSNGGITTTDPSDVTVLVDGVQVIPTAVDGQSGAVTLPFAPEIGATVTVRYHFNSWQDTFDYLANRGVTEVTLCGVTADRNDYIDGADFVLKDDKILWGTASLIEAGETTAGSTVFGPTQVSTTLVDVRQYLAPCTPAVNTNARPLRDTRTQFQLPLQPTTGNGPSTPLSAEIYSAVANGRVDLPTNRPDLVWAYWGYSVEDALERGRVEVTKVESSTSTITLAEPVPVGATVFATFYYNTLVDQDYSVNCVVAGPSGVGTYSIENESGQSVLIPQLGTKSAALATVTLQFPSGSERTPDVRLETPFDATAFTGPVEETVTVEFASQQATLAEYAIPASGPYYMVQGASDNLRIAVDGSNIDVDLSNPTGNGTGFPATLVGDKIVYDAASGGETYAIDSTNRDLDLEIDGVLIQASAVSGTTQTVSAYAEAVNQSAFGIRGDTASAGGATSITIPAASAPSDIDDYYNGWEVIVTAGTGNAATIRTVTDYNGTTGELTLDAGAFDATSVFTLYNPATAPVIKSATRFLSPTTIAAGEFDDLTISVTGDVTGATTLNATIAPGTYTSASALAAAVQSAVDTAITGAGAACQITVTADSSGRLQFALLADPTDLLLARLEFVADATPAEDFAILAGLDTAAAAGGGQATLEHGPVAFTSTPVVGVGGDPDEYDRLALISRITPGQTGTLDGQWTLDQCQSKVLGGTGADQAGLTPNEEGQAGIRATVMPATLFGEVGLSGGQDTNGQPVVTFFADGGTTPQNNVFKVTFEGTPITVEFTDGAGVVIPAGGSADVPLGPTTDANSIIGQIRAALTGAGFAATTALLEGAGIRFRGTSSASGASIVIGTGNANAVLGFSDGDTAFTTPVEAAVLVSALNSHSTFPASAVAKTVEDAVGATYLYVQSTDGSAAGTTSSVIFLDAPTDSALRPGTGLGLTNGDGNVGESAVEGFFVTSSDPIDGSGSANTSILNSGPGQDGIIGQTYRDAVTGLTFTILPREGGASYPTGATFTFTVREVTTTDSNLPTNAIPGVETLVSNTSGVTVGDTAVVQTFEKGGNQPSVGDVYYVSYNYRKQDYSTALFTKQASVEAAYGAASPQNPVSLASYLALLNGAVLIAIKQVQKDTDTDADGVEDTASESAFLTAIDEVEGPTPGGVLPDTITPLKGDSLTLFQYLARHCDVQSSIRYRAERTAICGFSAGTQPRDAGNTAQAVARSSMRLLYPDILTLSLSRADGSTDTYLLDGTYFAAAWAGNRASPTIDVATPWTRGRVFGFDDLARTLDAVEQNQLAVKGVTVFTQRQSIIECRHGLTTDMSNVLTKTPTVLTIAHEVQRQARATLDQFIGIKFLSKVTGDIEGQLSVTLKGLVDAQIIAAFTGVNANVSPTDPTACEVEAAYQPVFPLLYVIVTFNLRSSL